MTTYTGVAISGVAAISGTSNTNATPVRGTSSSGWLTAYGGQFTAGAAAVHGYSDAAGAYALYGYAPGAEGYGVIAQGSERGVDGVGQGANSVGIVGEGSPLGILAEATKSSPPSFALWAEGPGYAAIFAGPVYISGHLTKAGGGFLIDHPTDPANKLLEHAFVEAPERKNVYDGVAIADVNGEARIRLPSYFEALNQEFRYLLTALGAPAPNLHVKHEVLCGELVVAGGVPGEEISWQVTGIRQDAWAKKNPLIVERDKVESERGWLFAPEAFGQPAERGVAAARRPMQPDVEGPPAQHTAFDGAE